MTSLSVDPFITISAAKLPGHVAVAVEGVGDEVESAEGDESVEGPRGDAADLVRVEGERVQVDQAVKQLLVDVGNGVLGKCSGKN